MKEGLREKGIVVYSKREGKKRVMNQTIVFTFRVDNLRLVILFTISLQESFGK